MKNKTQIVDYQKKVQEIRDYCLDTISKNKQNVFINSKDWRNGEDNLAQLIIGIIIK